MKLSVREKGLWLLLLSLVAVFGYHFAVVLPPQLSSGTPPRVITFVGMTVLLVISQIVGSIVLALGNHRELSARIQSDERDAMISCKATRVASYILSAGAFSSICAALLVPGNLVFIHVLLAFWVAAQLAEITVQLVLYRRDV